MVSISIPFALDSAGLVATEQSAITALGQRVTALASTQPTERIMETNFGIDTAALLFTDVTDEFTSRVLGQALVTKMGIYEPDAVLTGIQPIANAAGTGVAAILATAAPKANASSSATSSSVLVRADGTVVTLS